jgi:sugar fermentation stimulation protein A
MKYNQTVHGKLIQRVNRFIAKVVIEDQIVQVHIKNTGRLIELLTPGADVLLERSGNPNRKTAYSLIAVNKAGTWINIDSLAPNAAVWSAMRAGRIPEFGHADVLKKEVTYGSSRFDLYWEKGNEKGFIEVKGVTLEKDGVAMFPDAPTKRGAKHVMELVNARENGYHAAVLFLIQMSGCHVFTPHQQMDPQFTLAVEQAAEKGVRILAYDSNVTKSKLVLNQSVPVQL